MSCDLQKSRKEFVIDYGVGSKLFSQNIGDPLASSSYRMDTGEIDYDELMAESTLINYDYQGTQREKESQQDEDYFSETLESQVSILQSHQQNNQSQSSPQIPSRNIAAEKQVDLWVRVFPKTNIKNFKPVNVVFEREGILQFMKENGKSVFCTVKDKQIIVYSKKLKPRTIILTLRFDIFRVHAQLIYDRKKESAHLLRLRVQGTNPQIFDFYHNNSEELQNWFKDINYQISASESCFTEVINFIPLNDSYKKICIQEEDFTQAADSLDLVFFKGKSISSSFTRFVCNSSYEHIALILRGQDDKIFFFEAGSKFGVTLYTWERFKEHNWKDYYSQKLICDRTFKMIDNLEKFVKSAVGKPYSLSITKLFRKKSFIDGPESEPDRTYFCSELIAAAYKRAELLSPIIASSTYWPGQFGEDASPQLNLLKGAHFGPECVINL